jgi:hypothetical protein
MVPRMRCRAVYRTAAPYGSHEWGLTWCSTPVSKVLPEHDDSRRPAERKGVFAVPGDMQPASNGRAAVIGLGLET